MSVDPDSRARTYLASERTFLAWFRTGITLVALGLAAAQFLTRDVVVDVPLRRGIAMLLAATGVVVTSIGARRYFLSNRQIAIGEFQPATVSVVVTTLLMLILSVVAIVFIFLLQR